MNASLVKIRNYPAFLRIAPFLLLMLFLLMQDLITSKVYFDVRYFYVAKVLCAGLLLAFLWRAFDELKQPLPKSSLLLVSVLAGVLVFLLWINLCAGWMSLGNSTGFDPRLANGEIAWWWLIPRLIGATLIVPIIEELFWRSFLMRWIHSVKFIELNPTHTGFVALMISSILFGFAHSLWLAGVFAGLVYGLLYIKSNNLWASILAHATTNGLLGIWVLQTQQWQFW